MSRDNAKDIIQFLKLKGSPNTYECIVESNTIEGENGFMYTTLEDIVHNINKAIEEGYSIMDMS